MRLDARNPSAKSTAMQVPILIVALVSALPGTTPIESNDGQEITAVVHFALIRPEADSAVEETTLTPDARWLRRTKKTSAKPSDPSGTKKGSSKTTARTSDKAETAVTPLRRDRPKREIDPPKTRRRALGW